MRTHEALDGALARIRLPGGRIRADQLAAAARVATEHGDGHLELTSRGNLQLRGLHDPGAAAEALLAAGLGSEGEADTVRNIVASPLAGRIGGHGGVDDTIAELDERLRAGVVGGLSGRFLFGVDDGRGDVLAQRPDVAAQWCADGESAALVVADESLGQTSRAGVVESLIRVATRFAEVSSGAWRIRELDPAARRALIGGLAADLDGRAAEAPVGVDTAAPLVGWLPQDDGAVMLGALAPAGRLPARTAAFLAAVDAPIIVTPQREILLADLTEAVADTVLRVLAPMGLVFDANSPWTLLSCCAGRPGCARAQADVRADIAAYVSTTTPSSREHWVGCSRGCGSPTTQHVRVEAQSDGTYRRTVLGSQAPPAR
ncbi:precorrin-3B synthase [Gordonia araii NBRC 100433]|uniref:Precorrin-3B synthase n=1 Tax=Gordonia araii NBRC 100433 TaxID=1073574 RepID=G7H7Q9_9ACTN|nr:precorrin-3B synthase [Gordonia araii]GAB11884.1 precorrin-3B synthase [Gordonia araii NBRC 100433]